MRQGSAVMSHLSISGGAYLAQALVADKSDLDVSFLF